MARGYYGSNDDGMDIARNAMGLVQGLGGLVQQGQRVEDGRRELADDAGIRQAYEHIAQRVGQGGNISALDGDPVMNSRHGIMAMGKFMADRANSEQSRLAMLKNMAEADDTLYQQYFRPLAVTAMDAYQKGDMRAFGQAAGQLSRISPFPYQYQMDGDGNFQEFFRSSGEGGFVDTGERITPQQVYQSIQGIMNGEQRVLRGMDMREHYVNPNFLAAAARYKMGTILGNAAALQDPAQWIPLEKDGRVVFAIPQNRHDDYSAAPSYRVFDETGKSSFMVANMDELLGMGYRPSAAKAGVRVLQAKGASKGAGVSGISGGASLPKDIRKEIAEVCTSVNGLGDREVDRPLAGLLEIVVGKTGLTPMQAHNSVERILADSVARLGNMPEYKGASSEQLRSAAIDALYETYSGQGKPETPPDRSVPSPRREEKASPLADTHNRMRTAAGSDAGQQEITSGEAEKPKRPAEARGIGGLAMSQTDKTRHELATGAFRPADLEESQPVFLPLGAPRAGATPKGTPRELPFVVKEENGRRVYYRKDADGTLTRIAKPQI